MIKKIMISLCLVVPFVQADWLDDLALFVEPNGSLNQLKSETCLQSYIDKDEQEIVRYEKKLEANDEDGLWATVRGGTYQVQWATAKARLRYHKKVLEFIKGLPKNDKDRQKFIDHLTMLKKHEHELVLLKQKYAGVSGWAESLKAGSMVAAKELHIQGRKTLIRSSFIL